MKHALSPRSIILTLLLFTMFLLIGYQAGNTDFSPGFTANLEKTFAPLLRLGPLPLMAIIFLNNSVKALLVILLGVIPFLFPSVFIMINSFVLGLVVNRVVAEHGLGFTLLGLLPHGLLELSAILVATALGLQVGFSSFASFQGKKGQLQRQYKASLAVYLKLILPALFVAAIIETLVGTYVLPLFVA